MDARPRPESHAADPSTAETSTPGRGRHSILDELTELDAGQPVTTGYRIAHQAAAATLVLIGGALVAGGLQLGLDRAGVPGPGLFPVIIGDLFVILGVALFVQAARGRLDRSDDAKMPDRMGVRRILITALATGLLLSALMWIGYLLAMTLYVFALLVFVGGRRVVGSIIIAVGFGAGSYYAFTLGLKLGLPHAAIGFLRMMGL